MLKICKCATARCTQDLPWNVVAAHGKTASGDGPARDTKHLVALPAKVKHQLADSRQGAARGGVGYKSPATVRVVSMLESTRIQDQRPVHSQERRTRQAVGIPREVSIVGPSKQEMRHPGPPPHVNFHPPVGEGGEIGVGQGVGRHAQKNPHGALNSARQKGLLR